MRFAVLSVLVAIAAGCVTAPEGGRIKVACIGDSIVYGSAMTNRVEECFPTQLQRILGDKYEVRNFGDPGAGVYMYRLRSDGKTPRAWRRGKHYRPACDFKPDIVVCNLGINDANEFMREYKFDTKGKAEVEPGTFRHQYVEMLESLTADGKKPRFIIWTRLGPCGKKHSFNGKPYQFVMEHALQGVAEDIGAETLDMYTPLIPLAETDDFAADGIHPEGGAQRVIAEITARKITGR